ncbi:DUF58 domain-containing protein [Desulfogranum japonicum]|uniref:DUF58 domain-containing protein n=1 Tax=Desulfogranum japonicum TaxID=231447 RepID=UPI000416C476|nr:DUF58 domain-containing protein [Desulfogranum japonicum]
MFFPTRRLAVILVFLLSGACLADFWPAVANFWAVCAAFGSGLVLLDAWKGWQPADLGVQRHVRHSLSVSGKTKVELELTNNDRRSLTIQCKDRWPQVFVAETVPALILHQGQKVIVTYSLEPQQRGEYSVPGIDTLIDSPFGLWRKRRHFSCLDKVRVFPNFRELGRYSLLATHHQLSQMGIRKLVRRGQGNEFHQLREYRVGDSLQQIDWKATSRYRKPISKEYQDERDQQIVFVLDCGRRMRHKEQGRSHFDYALNSILLLAHVAIRQGDSVGLFAFGRQTTWYPPQKREDAVRSLLLAMYDLYTTADSADYRKATSDLLSRQHRRALMVVVTNSRAEEHDDVHAMVRQLRRQHLVVVADLYEKELDKCLVHPVFSLQDALRLQALVQYKNTRKLLKLQLQQLGCHALDVTPDRLPPALVNTYLEIKSAGAL